MKVDQCDACKRVSDGNEDWFSFRWSPYRTVGRTNGPSYYSAEADMPMSNNEKVACSQECFIALIKYAAEDMKQWANVLGSLTP